MATTFKNFLSNDIANARTLLHESIPITGSIISGTYDTVAGVKNSIKTYGHGMFESVYDYPYLSSSANHIFDMTAGYSSASPLSGSSNTQNTKKINLYNQMAQYLVGYDETGSIKKFTIPIGAGTVMNEVFVVPFSRLLTKDEVKKGSFSIEFGLTGSHTFGGRNFDIRGKLFDYSGSSGYYVDSPAGEYGVLYATSSDLGTFGSKIFNAETLGDATTMPALGLLYYQAGIAVVSGALFNSVSNAGALSNALGPSRLGTTFSGSFNCITGSTLNTVSEGIQNRIYNISFNNTTELNSTIYFCRAGHSEFNYSSNPTYLSGSKLRVKTRASDTPVSYFSTVGLYSADNELLAVAKLSEPLRKDPTNEVTLRVRLDY